MAIMKCKMCGGDLEIANGTSVAECEYCGTKQTMPKVDDEVIQNLFNRANNLRLKSEFDKAEQIYEKIVQQNDAEAEAHWGIVLCKYGIEYVEDPTTFKRIPTCHRTSYDAVTADADYLAAVQHADAFQKSIYEAEAKAIDAIQKDILNIVKNEKPFDVFLCYKETDENGKRTADSVIANEIYHQLTMEGLKVFYAAITLEDKLGQAYEPYIFAALNSAKVMLVIGTKPQYFSAIWVKNEWSRFLKLMKTDRSKLLIPCYRDMDAYDLPEEFSHLQAQDMSKIGFINDVVRGIKKVATTTETKNTVVKETVVTGNTNVEPLLKRVSIFLEDRDWSSADEYCEKVLDIDPENPRAYLGKLMAELKVCRQEDLPNQATPFSSSNNYQKAVRFADGALKNTLTGYIEHIITRNENDRLEGIYSRAKLTFSKAISENDFYNAIDLFASVRHYKDSENMIEQCKEKALSITYLHAKRRMELAKTEIEFKEIATMFKRISSYRDAKILAEECNRKAVAAHKDAVYAEAMAKMDKKNYITSAIPNYEAAAKLLESISGWKDADQKRTLCEKIIAQLQAQAESERIEWEKKVREEAKKAKIMKLVLCIIAGAIALGIIGYNLATEVIIPNNKYNDALALMNEGMYYEAIEGFQELGDYKDSKSQIVAIRDKIKEERYDAANELFLQGKYQEAIEAFELMDTYKDSQDKVLECKYQLAVALLHQGKREEAIKAFTAIISYSDSAEKIVEMWGSITVRDTIAAGGSHTVGLKADGTVLATGKNNYSQCNVDRWTDIVAIAASINHTIGLKADGTVVAAGASKYGQSEFASWKNIVAIAAGASHTVGMKADGSVVAVGNNGFNQCDVDQWKDIVAISAGNYHTVGLKADGTVDAVGSNENGQCDVGGWTDIIAIAAGEHHTIGLKADGTVVAAGDFDDGRCDVDRWTDIVAIAAGGWHTVGLKADGTVVAVGSDANGRCDVTGWTDIVAIAAGQVHTVGLKSDGTVVAVGSDYSNQCDVEDWNQIALPK